MAVSFDDAEGCFLGKASDLGDGQCPFAAARLRGVQNPHGPCHWAHHVPGGPMLMP